MDEQHLGQELIVEQYLEQEEIENWMLEWIMT